METSLEKLYKQQLELVLSYLDKDIFDFLSFAQERITILSRDNLKWKKINLDAIDKKFKYLFGDETFKITSFD